MSWRDGSGTIVVEHYLFDGMAHGLPIDMKSCATSPFGLDDGISSTLRIAKSWGFSGKSATPKIRPRKTLAKPVFTFRISGPRTCSAQKIPSERKAP
jgi:hypothetical protein